jgi:hypothetical protein
MTLQLAIEQIEKMANKKVMGIEYEDGSMVKFNVKLFGEDKARFFNLSNQNAIVNILNKIDKK